MRTAKGFKEIMQDITREQALQFVEAFRAARNAHRLHGPHTMSLKEPTRTALNAIGIDPVDFTDGTCDAVLFRMETKTGIALG